jgi:short-subunit dehydrogenase
MVDLNCRAVVDFTYKFLPAMKARKKGAVIVIASVVGAVPAPWFSVYSATKSFDLYFGEALWGECVGTGVDVLTVLPGLTRTEFQGGAGLRDYHSPYRSAQHVVDSALSALGKRAIVVDGLHNKLLVYGSRFLPRGLLLWLSRFIMKKELGGSL